MTSKICLHASLRWLTYTIALALAYALLARLSKLSVITYFGESLLWLPAGLGATAALLLGTRAVPGIWLGALMNSWFTIGTLSTATLLTSIGSAIEPPAIALLAGRLAQVGCYATRAALTDPVALALRLCASFVLGGVVAPTIGTIALCAAGLLPWHEFGRLWLGSWIGEMIGILTLTPLLWHWAQRQQQRHGLGDVLVAMAITTTGLGLFAFALHETAESGRSLVLNEGATQVWIAVEQQISYALLGAGILMGTALLAIARQQERNKTNDLEQNTRASLKRTRELNNLLLVSGAILYTRRAEGNFDATFISENIRSITGHTSSECLQTPHFWKDHLHPEEAPDFFARLAALFEKGEYVHDYRFRAKDGRYLWLRDQIKLERDDQGRPLEMVGVMMDITERKAAEAQLRESQKLEAIGQLTGGLAHDFNNLLGIIVGNLDLIGARLPAGDAQLRLQHRAALQAALRGAEVTRSLLAVARRQPLEAGSYDVNALLAESLPLAQSSAGSAVKVLPDLAAGELRARIDAGGLSNIILNLVINARDAMEGAPGEHQITLRTRRVHVAPGTNDELAPGAYALLEVADTGTGMSEQIKAQAFEPFFTTKNRGPGTGLGLAMVYGYATQLGGTARIQSEPGHGATVQLYLPMDAQAMVAPEAAEALRPASLQANAILDTAPEAALPPLARTTRPPAPAPLGANQGQRVLVVDDEEALRELACNWLDALGLRATAVHSPAVALESLAAEPFDILFTDIVMPGGMDGIALAREARARHPYLQIVLTSGYAQGLIDIPNLPGTLISKPYRKNDLAKHFAPPTPT